MDLSRSFLRANHLSRAVTFSIFLVSFNVWSQVLTTNTRWGNLEDLSKTSRISIIDFSRDGGFYLVKEKPRGTTQTETPYVIEYHDKNLSNKKSKTLVLKDEAGKYSTDHVVSLKGKIWVFFSRVNRKKNALELFAREINRGTLDFTGEKKKLVQVELSDETPLTRGRFMYQLSPDSSRVFLLRDLAKEKDGSELFSFAILDGDLNVLWQKRLPMSFNEGRFQMQSLKVSNDGQVYVLNQNNGLYEIIRISDCGDSVSRYPIRLGSWFLSGMQMEIGNSNNLLLASFYSPTRPGNAKGIYFLNVDLQSGEVKAKTYTEFDNQFILSELHRRDFQKVMDRSDQNEEAELYQYSISDLILEKDGSVLLMGEQKYTYSNTNYEPVPYGYSVRGSYVTNSYMRSSALTPRGRSFHYVFNDVIAIKVNDQGKMEWARKVHKSQDTFDDHGMYSSFALYRINGNVCLLFNDNPKNINEDIANSSPKDFSGGRSVLTFVTLTSEGEQIRQWFYKSVDAEVKILPKSGRIWSDREMILIGRNQDYQQLVRMEIR